MRTNTKKILGAVAVAGLVVVGGSAFTAGGVSRATGVGTADALGGTVTQTVTGAEISSIVYQRAEDGSGAATGMTVTFSAALAAGQTVTANGTLCTADATTTSAEDYICTVVDASNDIVVSDVLN